MLVSETANKRVSWQVRGVDHLMGDWRYQISDIRYKPWRGRNKVKGEWREVKDVKR